MKYIYYTLILLISPNISCNKEKKESKTPNTMQTVASKNHVNQSVEEVWNKLIAFGGTEKFVPNMIEKVVVKGNGIGAIRTIYLKPEGIIKEELTYLDIANKVLKFKILSTPMSLKNYVGTITVSESNDEKCLVNFTSEYIVLSENIEEINTIIKKFQETFISNLHK